MFYFLWLGPHAGVGGPWDITRILERDPGAMGKPDSPLWGPLHAPHHWGESIFGYYTSDDPYVLRKHAQMLSDAGVDAVAFDVTNQLTYRDQYTALLRTWQAVRDEGGRTPQVVFLCPFGQPGKVVRELWRDLYEPGRHRDLWFQWGGKPLILADVERLGEEAGESGEVVARRRDFFTWRAPQPDYFQGPTRPDMWGWLEVHPQHVFRDSKGTAEQMAVGVAQNAVNGRLGSMSESAGARGRSFHAGARDTRPGAVARGLNFAEQWEHALRADPRALFVTGWNEWIAGRHAEFNGVREPVMFVDQFDHEHSRDIEPMKGGHGDAYYYQFAAAVRRYKGTPAVPAAATGKSIDIAGPFSQWDDVAPGFADDAGDVAHRDHPGYAGHTRYINRSGRNDIVLVKSTSAGGVRHFLAVTRRPLTPASDPAWMWLLVDADGDVSTGWEGFDLMVNRLPPSNGLAPVERCVGGWKWESVGQVPIRFEGCFLHLSIPESLMGGGGVRGHIDFKWADAMPENGDIVSWLDGGDTAPNGRFVYRIQTALKTAP